MNDMINLETIVETIKNLTTKTEANVLKDEILNSENNLNIINYIRYEQYHNDDLDIKTFTKINKFLDLDELKKLQFDNQHIDFGADQFLKTDETITNEEFNKSINFITKSTTMFGEDEVNVVKLKCVLKDEFEHILIVEENEKLVKYGFINHEDTNYAYKLEDEYEEFYKELIDADIDTIVNLNCVIFSENAMVNKTFRKIDIQDFNEENFVLTKRTKDGVTSLNMSGSFKILKQETFMHYDENKYKPEEPEQGAGNVDPSELEKQLGLTPGTLSGTNVIGIPPGGGMTIGIDGNGNMDMGPITFDDEYNGCGCNCGNGCNCGDDCECEDENDGVSDGENDGVSDGVSDGENDSVSDVLFEAKTPTDIVVLGAMVGDRSDFQVTDDESDFSISSNRKVIVDFVSCDGFGTIMESNDFIKNINNVISAGGCEPIFENGVFNLNNAPIQDFYLIKDFVGEVKLDIKTKKGYKSLVDVDEDYILWQYPNADVIVDFNADINPIKIDEKVFAEMKLNVERKEKLDNINK